MFFSHGSNHSRGVIVMFKPGITFVVEKTLIDEGGRYVIIKGKCQGEKLILGSVYFPTRNKENAQCDFLSDLNKIICSVFSQEYSLIIGGDFNVIMNHNLDYMGASNVSKSKYRDSLLDFLDKLDLIDVWRKRHPNKKEFTFRQKQPLVQSRLDYIFISSKVDKLIRKSEILPSVTPDHAGVRIEFNNLVDSFVYGNLKPIVLDTEKTNFEIELMIFGRLQKLCDIKSRRLYDYFIEDLQKEYILHVTDGNCQFDLGMTELKETFTRMKCAMLCNKHREFQYKQLQGAVYTKRELFKFGFESDHFCSFCRLEVETYQHLFLDCLKVKRLWQEVIQKLHLIEIDIDDWKPIFMGISGNTARIFVINCIIFLVKYIIFISRKEGTLPSVQKTVHMLKNYRDEEYKIAFKKGKLGMHLQKWEQIDAFLL